MSETEYPYPIDGDIHGSIYEDPEVYNEIEWANSRPYLEEDD